MQTLKVCPMPSPPAISPATIYHIFNRGNNRDNIFVEERNYGYFLDLLEKYLSPVAEIYAYCLLKNHFHLLVRILPLAVLKALGVTAPPFQHFSNFFNAYAKTFNHTYGRTGSLFQHPFGRVLVRTDDQLLQTIRYIHLNPLKHGFVDDFRDWPFSSYLELLSTEESILAKDAVFGHFGGRDAFMWFHEDQTLKVPPTGTLRVYQIDDP
jgi:REP element-mobilizing transposase RayT